MKDRETPAMAMKRFTEELYEWLDSLESEEPDVIERMKNCVNCDHFEVCVVVHDRKRRQAGDYSPCGKWKLVEK